MRASKLGRLSILRARLALAFKFLQMHESICPLWVSSGCGVGRDSFQPLAIEARMGRSGLELATGQARGQTLGRAISANSPRRLYCSAGNGTASAKPDALQLGGEVADYSQTEDAVEVRLADGRRISGNALIGADGIHSPVREQMLGAEKPIFTGNIAWRAVVPMAALAGVGAATRR